MHWARPAGAHHRESIGQRFNQILYLADAPGFLDHGREHRRHVAVVAIVVLQGAGVELVCRHLPGDDEECRAVIEGVGHRDHQIHGARAGGRIDRQRLPGKAIIDIGHETGRLFYSGRDVAYAVGLLVQAVEQADGAVSGITEDVGYFLFDQVLGDDIGAAHLVGAGRVGGSPRLRRWRGIAGCRRAARLGGAAEVA